jgi:hypothetical protein
MIVHIISEGEFEMNKNHPSFKDLEELITLRNRILHNKEFLKEFDCPINGEIVGDAVFIPIEKSKIDFSIDVADNYIDTLTKEKCLRFGNALSDFKKHVMTPALNNEMNVNPLILKPGY